jgi:nitrogen fixation protein NifU and related proteins
MTDPLEEVQNRIHGDLRAFYSETTIDHIIRPRNAGSISTPDGFASCSSSCGEGMGIWLKVRDNTIEDITFWTDGCAATIACGSMATELAKGETVAEALAITAQNIASALDKLPEGNFHCAELAADALHTAMKDYLLMQRDPWKKAYRKK